MSTIADNKKAYFDYEILDTYQAGLVLSGQEVKAAKAGAVSLKGAYVTFHGKSARLTNAHITKYKPAGPLPDYDPTQSRPLLLKKREMNYLREKSLEKGLTIVPLKMYTKNHLIKIEVAVARGKHHYDKRETMKKRDVEREVKRKLDR